MPRDAEDYEYTLNFAGASNPRRVRLRLLYSVFHEEVAQE